MKTTLYFVRHAQSHQRSDLHHSEWPLSDKGVEQSELLADYLSHLPIDQVYSSPYRRCLQTIQPFAYKKQLPVRIEHDLRERLVSLELVPDFTPIWKRSWQDFSYALPECESAHDSQKRFFLAVDRLVRIHADQNLLISSHGFVIALFLHQIYKGYGIEHAEQIRNPDLIQVTHDSITGQYDWKTDYHLPELNELATHYHETPQTFSEEAKKGPFLG